MLGRSTPAPAACPRWRRDERQHRRGGGGGGPPRPPNPTLVFQGRRNVGFASSAVRDSTFVSRGDTNVVRRVRRGRSRRSCSGEVETSRTAGALAPLPYPAAVDVRPGSDTRIPRFRRRLAAGASTNDRWWIRVTPAWPL